jgi:hypothetical protein
VDAVFGAGGVVVVARGRGEHRSVYSREEKKI